MSKKEEKERLIRHINEQVSKLNKLGDPEKEALMFIYFNSESKQAAITFSGNEKSIPEMCATAMIQKPKLVDLFMASLELLGMHKGKKKGMMHSISNKKIKRTEVN